MSLVYFEGVFGVITLDRHRIIGAEQCRLPSDMPTKVLLDCDPYSIRVRNGFDDVQSRLMASSELQEVVGQIRVIGHLNQEDLARLRAAWERWARR